VEINRNQYFALGVVVLLLGIQFRNVESFTLNAEVSQVIREQLKKPQDAQFVSASKSNGFNNPLADLFATTPAATSISARLVTVKPPAWLGWALLSTGGVLVLHSLAMKRPE
jgi:hypothetical protein